nr:MAG TPA: hypothetical protein [Caudoviricetes sp.]
MYFYSFYGFFSVLGSSRRHNSTQRPIFALYRVLRYCPVNSSSLG